MPYENMSPAITRPTAQDHFALLYVGVCNRQRYVESLIRWTNLLHVMYGYPLGNIRILVGTYSNPSWASMVAGTDVTYDATRTDLDDTLAAYAAGSGDAHELGANDKLFIFTFNHGGQDTSGSYLCCDNFSDKYHASDFATRIGAMQCRQIVLLAAQFLALAAQQVAERAVDWYPRLRPGRLTVRPKHLRGRLRQALRVGPERQDGPGRTRRQHRSRYHR